MIPPGGSLVKWPVTMSLFSLYTPFTRPRLISLAQLLSWREHQMRRACKHVKHNWEGNFIQQLFQIYFDNYRLQQLVLVNLVMRWPPLCTLPRLAPTLFMSFKIIWIFDRLGMKWYLTTFSYASLWVFLCVSLNFLFHALELCVPRNSIVENC